MIIFKYIHIISSFAIFEVKCFTAGFGDKNGGEACVCTTMVTVDNVGKRVLLESHM
jgi:hypothetical protein